MWQLDHKESWALKNWCFWTVVLEKTLESPLDCKEIKSVSPKGNQSWIHWKDWCWDWSSNTLATWYEELTHLKRPWYQEKIEDRRRRGRQRMRWLEWHHQLNGHEFEWTPGVGDGQGCLTCYIPWGHKESDTTEWLNWTDIFTFICCWGLYSKNSRSLLLNFPINVLGKMSLSCNGSICCSTSR